jgi:hypothetical protein
MPKKRLKASSMRRRGVTRPGAVTRPSEMLPELSSECAESERLRAAPAPGVPMSAREYDRLKEQARTRPAPKGAPSEEDRPVRN